MPIKYSPLAKQARMEAVEKLMKGGALEIGTAGMAAMLARIPIPAESCKCRGDTISCNPQEGAFAISKGNAASARVCTSDGKPIITGLTVGRSGSGADVIMDYTSLDKRQIVTVEHMSFTHA